MSLVIVPNSLRDAINEKLEEARPQECGDVEWAQLKEDLYPQLVAYYDEHGRVPSFSLTRRTEEPTE